MGRFERIASLAGWLSACLVLAFVAGSHLGHAQQFGTGWGPPKQHQANGSEKLLSAVAANASSANRTITLSLGGVYPQTIIQVNATRNAYTAISATCTMSYNTGGVYATDLGSQVTFTSSASTLDSSTLTRTVTISSSADVPLWVNTSLADSAKCVISLTGGGASDLMDVYARSGVN